MAVQQAAALTTRQKHLPSSLRTDSHHALDWFADANDIPAAISQETGGPGDDLCVEILGADPIEVQVKHGLKKGEESGRQLTGCLRGCCVAAIRDSYY